MSGKRTLLDMVQGILSSMDSDEVNSITDTTEAEQVAGIIEDTFRDMVAEEVIPEHKTLNQLVASGTTARPTHMTLPTGVDAVEIVQYDKSTTAEPDTRYEDITYMSPYSFLNMTGSRTESDANVDAVTDPSNVTFLIYNDRFPQFYTSFDDHTLIFDAYDSVEESTLTASRSLIWCREYPTFTLSDSFTPDLDDNLFQLLYNRAKQQCFVELLQRDNPVANQRARKQQTQHRRRWHKTHGMNIVPAPNMGRPGRFS